VHNIRRGLLLPRIADLLRSDPTIDQFFFEGHLRDSSKSSSQLLELLRSCGILIDESSLGRFHVVFEDFENRELTDSGLAFDFS
jgi:hypothetical protein